MPLLFVTLCTVHIYLRWLSFNSLKLQGTCALNLSDPVGKGGMATILQPPQQLAGGGGHAQNAVIYHPAARSYF